MITKDGVPQGTAGPKGDTGSTGATGAAGTSLPAGKTAPTAIPSSGDYDIDITKATQHLTGTNSLKRIKTAGLTGGESFDFLFTGGPAAIWSKTEHSVTNSGGYAAIKAYNGTSVTMGATGEVRLTFDGTDWQMDGFPGISNA